MRAFMWSLLVCLFAASALHAQLDLIDPDDFVEPRLMEGLGGVFMSRFVAGVSRGYADQYRPLHQDVGFVHIANSLYWSGLQIDYKRTESRGEHSVEPDRDDRSFVGLGAPGDEETDSDPLPVPGPKNVWSLSWYQIAGERWSFRYRFTHATQFAERETAAFVRGLEDSDETRALQIDAGRRSGGRTQFVTLTYTELTRHSTLDETKQRTLTGAALLPIIRLGPGTLTPRMLVGAVAGEGPAIDIINPSLDLSMRIPRVDVNVHLIYSPVYRDLGVGSPFHHQVVLYADRALLVLALGGRKRQSE